MVAVKKDKVNGDALGTGRRKSSVARVRVRPGSGSITVNNKPLDEYFVNEQHRTHIAGTLAAVEHSDKVDVLVRVSGGGMTGQSGAVRMGLARALATDAEILLMDEAFSALDPLIRTDMQDILLDLQEELHKTIVFITHDLDEALRIGDRISILRDGEIVQQGDPQDIIMRPADDYISDFIKDINRGRVIGVRSVMTAASRATGPKLTEDTPIEDALQMLSSAGKDSGTVINGDGKTIGKIEMNNAIAAMARPERDKGTPRYK